VYSNRSLVLGVGAAVSLITCTAWAAMVEQLPFRDSFDSCRNWSTDDDASVSLSCRNGHYHFAVKRSHDRHESRYHLRTSVPRAIVAVDAASESGSRLESAGVACWTARTDTGYGASIGPRGWSMFREDSGTRKARNLPVHLEYRRPIPNRGRWTRIRLQCLTTGNTTVMKLAINGFVVATARDTKHAEQFRTFGVLVGSGSGPAAVDFDNFVITR
jgi:hypothetical protein